MFSYEKHKQTNQENYKEKASDHDTLGLDSSLYLAYRDAGELLARHLYTNRQNNQSIKYLDYGCGVGLSTQIYSNKIRQDGFDVHVTGVDLSESNLGIARQKLTDADFRHITLGDKLQSVGKYDLITCNFVLVEMEEKEMNEVLAVLSSKLAENGILIVTNTTGRVYRPGNTWYSFNAEFPENQPSRVSADHTKLKYHEDQPVKMQVFANKDRQQGFTFSDYFHSGSAYRNAYATAGLKLLETHKPLGKEEDQIDWKSEKEVPPYKLHVLKV